ncbi:MAG: NAD(P)/FAD-dependent oxidoreductase, partial [Candidatus Cloacimonetes bacterium]|nr:NAD(P)/FAD-dependent oxidoreductase [Candidatus Cloacimonadota bacterium]
MKIKTAIIIGAGPAGLTAAYELLIKTDIKPIIFEATNDIGGISKTVNYKGNRIDLGGHRFFSKSERVMKWWQKILPLQGAPSKDDLMLDRKIPLSKEKNSPDPQKQDNVMLIRSRLSRIFFLRKFFDYPISINLQTFKNLGFLRIIKIGMSYIKARLFRIKNEKNLEDFFINRFGKELYLTFFKDYTEKVWGVPCNKIKPEWGAQRIKGLSISKAIIHALKNIFSKDASIDQKKTETSLIEQFMYPKYGPGQLWEKVAGLIEKKGGEVNLNQRVVGIETNNDKIISVTIHNEKNDKELKVEGDYFFSTMSVKDLIKSMGDQVPKEVRKISAGLIYRDFVTVGLLLEKMKIENETKHKTVNKIIPDNWIYIQERDVKVGRLQIFNNWSPYLVKDENKVWIGLEYFCSEGDELWEMTDENFSSFAIEEFCKIEMIKKEDVLDSVVIRMPKTYPAYFGSYDRFDVIREYTDKFENLFLIGRNGMHRYNNQDHSMLTAI